MVAEPRQTRIRRYGRLITTPATIIYSVLAGYFVTLGCALLLLRGTPHSVFAGYVMLHVTFVSGGLAAGIAAASLELWNARWSGFRPRAAEMGFGVAWGCFILMICTSGRGVLRLPWLPLSLLADIPILSLAGVFGWWISRRRAS